MTSHVWGRCALSLAALLFAVSAVCAQEVVDTAGIDYAAAALAFNNGLDELAVTEFEQFLKTHPNDKRVAKARYALGISYHRIKRYAKADKTLALVVADKGFANRATALYFQGQARRAAGRHVEAATVFGLLVTDYPAHSLADKAVVGAGESLYFGGKFAEAAKVLAVMSARFPKSPLLNHAIFIRGLSLYEGKDYATAATVLSDSLKKDPKGEQMPQVAYLLGSCLEQIAKKPAEFAAALAAYKQSYAHLDKSPYADDAMYRAAFLMSRRKNLPGAIKLLETLAKTKGELADTARLNAGQFAIQAGEHARAIALLKPLEKKTKSDLADDAAYFHGKALLADGKFARAVVQFDRAARFKKATYAAEVLFEGGVGQLKAKRFPDARKRFERFVTTYEKAKHPLLADAMFNAAAAAFGQKDYPASAAWCEKLLAAKPRDVLAADATFMKAQCEQQQGNFKAAAVTFATFAVGNEEHPKVNLAWLQCGIAQYRTKQFKEALVTFDRIPLMLRGKPPYCDSLFLAGDCSYNLGDFTAAVKRLRSN